MDRFGRKPYWWLYCNSAGHWNTPVATARLSLKMRERGLANSPQMSFTSLYRHSMYIITGFGLTFTNNLFHILSRRDSKIEWGNVMRVIDIVCCLFSYMHVMKVIKWEAILAVPFLWHWKQNEQLKRKQNGAKLLSLYLTLSLSFAVCLTLSTNNHLMGNKWGVFLDGARVSRAASVSTFTLTKHLTSSPYRVLLVRYLCTF